MENTTVRRRSVLRHHYTRTSHALIFGYRGVSDGAKLTYQAIDAFDWTDADGLRKGFAHPSIGLLATLRGASDRTIQRHLKQFFKLEILISFQDQPAQQVELLISLLCHLPKPWGILPHFILSNIYAFRHY